MHGRHVRQAYDTYVSDDFHHHNAYFSEDRESLLRGMEESARVEPDKSFTARQVIESGDRVAVLSHVRRGNVGIDIAVVRILVEMWDIGQQIPADSPNRLGMFQPPTPWPRGCIERARGHASRSMMLEHRSAAALEQGCGSSNVFVINHRRSTWPVT